MSVVGYPVVCDVVVGRRPRRRVAGVVMLLLLHSGLAGDAGATLLPFCVIPVLAADLATKRPPLLCYATIYLHCDSSGP
ncbi:hypothetical protein M430DRAFT_36681 [Amorphotheca resinae ATCC 22711]|uniref:Uncharacterized protein n=1 Tax=Amorphotheca resinae ATCC 22711 TaxID=857342 RepID=A0A2T3AV99_AMORE|nr:hypothetical protein M430DRAFT_36681 [Amorphotheca resinae ATCC 22711]PSS12597.1 hypothetical protein M430DRAFT_36681 [Amorphotheca resinae ATCC 22711]